MNIEKTCAWCGVIKKNSDFLKRKKNGKESLRGECKECTNKRRKEIYNQNKERILLKNKKYYEKNKEKILSYKKQYGIINEERYKNKSRQRYLENAEIKKQKRKEYYEKNRQACIQSVNNYVKNNKSKVRERQRKHHHKKRQSDFRYKILKILRGRITSAIKVQGSRKNSKTMNLIGCSIDFLKTHLESKFKYGMSWDNHGLKGWHIDHIIPCSKFDLTKDDEQKKCFHYTNLQPLWWHENIKKSNKC